MAGALRESAASGVQTDEQTRVRRRLAEIETKIAETLDRLPAHSVRPPLMEELLALEDERDRLVEQLARLRGEDRRPDG